jgi:hypothetical protein
MAVTITWFGFSNIGTNPIAVILESDGSLTQVNTTTGMATTMAPAGTITNPSPGFVGMTQWGNQLVVFVADQPNGYFLWNGGVFFKSGTLTPVVVVTDGGTGYSNSPTITASGGSGSGATFGAVVEGGIIISIFIKTPGSGYVSGDAPTLNITDATGTGATAGISIMPFGVSGTAVESYTSRIWVFLGTLVTFSAPDAPYDFDVSDGAGSFNSFDPFLRAGFVRGVNVNGFLYLLGDSSINYISGVQTSAGTPPITTFTNQNADPETGSRFPDSVQVFNRNIIMANASGIYVSYGGAVTKISDMLDGIYTSVFDFAGLWLSSAKSIIYGKKVYVILVPVIDQVSGQQVNKLFLWDQKKWFTSQQDVTLTFIAGQEIGSVLTAWGTDGTSLYPLFQQPSVNFTKTIQSKLWSAPGNGVAYNDLKSADRIWGLFQYNSSLSPDLEISIDSEKGSEVVDFNFSTAVTWINDFSDPVVWLNDSDDPVTWFNEGTSAAGIVTLPPQAIANNGVLLGMTVSTEAADVTLISLMISPQVAGYLG